MLKHFRDPFGSKAATLRALAEIRDRLERLESVPKPDPDDRVDARLAALSHRDGELQSHVDRLDVVALELTEQVGEIEDWRKDIILAVSDGIERTDRAERRIKATVARARRQLASLGYEDPGLEAEATELRLLDGDAGDKGGVLPVPAPVEETAPAPSSIRGVPAETLRRARGL